MNHQPPIDQRIVDEYFQLVTHKKTKDAAWLYAMVATYGLRPDELINFNWGPLDSICISTKKRLIYPLHPQWVLLFKLKEKQPYKMQDCWEFLSFSLYRAIAYQDVRLNITDLLLAHRIRKNYARSIRKQQPSSRVFATVS